MTAPDPYDVLPYPTRAQTAVHPDRLAVLGSLFGLEPPALTECRVLEIGCGDGGNLIPLAAVLPDSRCEGIDSSSSAVARGQDSAARSGLENVMLRCVGIEDAAAVLGEYDYILCHGVFSWVPGPVREAILQVCGSHLAPNGLALVSYNALPGGYARQALRQMLRWHVRDLASPSEQVEEARALLQLLEERMLDSDGHAQALRAELQIARTKEPAFLFHDDLAEHNHPFLLHEFMTAAARHHLRYVADADLTDLVRPALPEDLRHLLGALTEDRVEREQYLDFLVARRFRQTILCRATQTVASAPQTARLAQCWFSSPAANATPDKVPDATAVAAFERPGGPRLQTDFLPGKLAMARLSEVWPRRLSFRELEDSGRASAGRLPGATAWTPDTPAALCTFLLEAMTARLVHGHAFVPHTVSVAGLRPRAFPPARIRAAAGEFVVNTFHQMVRLEQPAMRALLQLLDGTRTREVVLPSLLAQRPVVASGPSGVWPVTPRDLESALAKLASHGLLVA